MWNTINIVSYCKPKYVIWENVKNLLSKKHIHNFEGYLKELEALGYNNYYEVLNAKDYGIPQNRERVFTVSIRKDIDNYNFKFPIKEELKLKLKDLLEEEVEEKYYLKPKMQEYIMATGTKGYYKSPEINPKIAKPILATVGKMHRAGIDNYVTDRCLQDYELKGGRWNKINESCTRVYNIDGLSPTIPTCQGGNTEPKIVARTPLNFLNRNGKKIDGDYSFCVDSCNTGGIKEINGENVRIRKLTPRECWRLMGFKDTDIDKCIKLGISNTQLYKQAGNSIVVPVLEKIFKNLFKEKK